VAGFSVSKIRGQGPGAATAALTGRFGPVGVLGPVTAWQVAAACSAGRLLAPGWPAAGPPAVATRVAP